MGSRRMFESVLAGTVALSLLGVFGCYVVATNQLLAATQLSDAYHAMRTSILLARAHCQVNIEVQCTQALLEASPEGIVLAAGLQKGIYTVDYHQGGLFVYPTSEYGNAGCRIAYTAPGLGVTQALLVVNTKRC